MPDEVNEAAACTPLPCRFLHLLLLLLFSLVYMPYALPLRQSCWMSRGVHISYKLVPTGSTVGNGRAWQAGHSKECVPKDEGVREANGKGTSRVSARAPLAAVDDQGPGRGEAGDSSQRDDLAERLQALEGSVNQMRLGIEEILEEMRAARAPAPEEETEGGAGGSSFDFRSLGGLLRSPSGGEGGPGGTFSMLQGVQDIKATFPPFGNWTRPEQGRGESDEKGQGEGKPGSSGMKEKEERNGSGDGDFFRKGRQKVKDKERSSMSRRGSSRSRRDKSEDKSDRRSKSVPPSQGESGTA